jgi:serine/threonine-protein kinase
MNCPDNATGHSTVSDDETRDPDPVTAPRPDSGDRPPDPDAIAALPAGETTATERVRLSPTAPLRRTIDPGRYTLHGELARGGMGAVIRARDVELGRDLAFKVLLEQHRARPEVVRRFVEEAQIGGQLQHPGIVPVHDLGTLEDHRPFFAMKLVRGRTLSALLAERASPADDLPRFLGIFEQVAQTVAYAHSKGVIHRDLKPANILVGSFGEVQVMDWGLAKVLHRAGDSAEAEAGDALIRTVRSEAAADASVAGSVMGTPAYMAPEQARGETDRIDERADVFGLGAILGEILTGRPPFCGASTVEVLGKASRAETSEALARVDACGAEADLIRLAVDCLAGRPEDRPRDAGAVAEAMTGYLANVQHRLRAAELARAEAQARAEEAAKRAKVERDRRRLTVGLAASLLALTVVAGSSSTYYLQQRQARAAAAAVLAKAGALLDQARARPDDLARWRVALAAVQQAGDALDGGDPAVRRRLESLRDQAEAGADAADRDRKLLDDLVDIRSAKNDDPDGSATDVA